MKHFTTFYCHWCHIKFLLLQHSSSHRYCKSYALLSSELSFEMATPSENYRRSYQCKSCTKSCWAKQKPFLWAVWKRRITLSHGNCSQEAYSQNGKMTMEMESIFIGKRHICFPLNDANTQTSTKRNVKKELRQIHSNVGCWPATYIIAHVAYTQGEWERERETDKTANEPWQKRRENWRFSMDLS